MNLKVTVRRTIVLSSEVLEDIEAEASTYTSEESPLTSSSLIELHAHVHRALDTIEAQLREQPQEPRPKLTEAFPAIYRRPAESEVQRG